LTSEYNALDQHYLKEWIHKWDIKDNFNKET
jgi:hypothetical protein